MKVIAIINLIVVALAALFVFATLTGGYHLSAPQEVSVICMGLFPVVVAHVATRALSTLFGGKKDV